MNYALVCVCHDYLYLGAQNKRKRNSLNLGGFEPGGVSARATPPLFLFFSLLFKFAKLSRIVEEEKFVQEIEGVTRGRATLADAAAAAASVLVTQLCARGRPIVLFIFSAARPVRQCR